MLSSVTINCQVTKIVMSSGSQLSELQNCNQCLKGLQDCLFNCQNGKSNCLNCENCRQLSKIVKNCQNCKNGQKCQNLSKFSRIVKIVENGLNCQKRLRNVKMLVRSSCFLVILIKCLKGHKSLGSLCNVKSKSESVSEWVTRSPIELLWTAKNHPVQDQYQNRTSHIVSGAHFRLAAKLGDFVSFWIQLQIAC